MPLRYFRRQYEKLSQFKRETNIGIMEAVWSVRRVARQLVRYDCVHHTASTAGVMISGAIAYNTRSPLVLICGTMTAQRYVHDILQPHVLSLCNGSQEPFFSTRQCSTSHGKGVTRLSSHCYYLSLPARSPFVSNRACMGSFGHPTSFNELEARLCENMERNVSRHTKTCMPYWPIVSHRTFALEGVQQGIKSSVLLTFL
ncbi:transposable element Tcb1 transposase [Trichonephila clavipes]|nr:transposable element Tcb1 transposase [Trichonephila clavipes]